MKALFMTLFVSGILTSQAISAERDYQCIADRLQAINSDIYYNLSSADIEAMVTIPEMFGHIDAVNAEKQCLLDKKKYECAADALQAINSDIYYNLSKSDIDAMISIPEMVGHIDAVRVARQCGLL